MHSTETKTVHGIRTNSGIWVTGRLTCDPTYSHSMTFEDFFKFELEVPRISGVSDVLQVTLSDRVCNTNTLRTGDIIRIGGSVRTYNESKPGERSKLQVIVFTHQLEIIESLPEIALNEVTLEGYVCKPPIFRTTPNGCEICDLLIAVNRTNGKKSDYIPCIAWSRAARFSSNLPVGQAVQLSGRLQSRKYKKRLSDTDVEERIAYELSISEIGAIQDDPAPDGPVEE